MVFKTSGKIYRLKAIILLDRLSELLKVFILEINFIESFVDGTNVLILDTLKERSDQSDMTCLLHG